MPPFLLPTQPCGWHLTAHPSLPSSQGLHHFTDKPEEVYLGPGGDSLAVVSESQVLVMRSALPQCSMGSGLACVQISATEVKAHSGRRLGAERRVSALEQRCHQQVLSIWLPFSPAFIASPLFLAPVPTPTLLFASHSQLSVDSDKGGHGMTVEAGIQIRGVSHTRERVLVWSGTEAQVYDLTAEGPTLSVRSHRAPGWPSTSTPFGDDPAPRRLPTPIVSFLRPGLCVVLMPLVATPRIPSVAQASFPRYATSMAMGKDAIFECSPTGVNLLEPSGVTRMTLPSDHMHGPPVCLDLRAEVLAIVTREGFVDLYRTGLKSEPPVSLG